MLAKALIQKIDQIICQKSPGQRVTGGETVCFYCGCELENVDIDHVTPRRLGGLDNDFNLVVSCPSCNRSKNGKHPVYFLMQKLENMPDDQMIEYLARILYHDLVTKPN